MSSDQRDASALPTGLHRVVSLAIGPLVDALVAIRMPANAITAASLVMGLAAGFALANGSFGWASLCLLVACVGDALDGAIARRTCTESIGGALFDASADRYQEFFAFAGLAVFFRANTVMMTCALVALLGAFMVSYGSAKAEGARVPVPPSVMRRPERAACLWLGVALTAAARACNTAANLPTWLESGPILAALGFIGLAANVSAVLRLHSIARSARTPRQRHESMLEGRSRRLA